MFKFPWLRVKHLRGQPQANARDFCFSQLVQYCHRQGGQVRAAARSKLASRSFSIFIHVFSFLPVIYQTSFVFSRMGNLQDAENPAILLCGDSLSYSIKTATFFIGFSLIVMKFKPYQTKTD